MSLMESFGYPSAGAAKSTLFEEMRKAGVSRIEAHYSGGNDEGGVDSIEKMYDAQGGIVTIESLRWEHPLWEAADRMLSTEFGSWAGDFSAYGVLFADLKENRVWREGEQSSYSGDGHEY